MSALDVLPREVLAKCLEFLSFDQAVGLPRVVAAIERTHRFKNSSHAFGTKGTLWNRVVWPKYLLIAYSEQVGRRLLLSASLSPDYDWDADIDQSLFILSSGEGGLSGCELFGSGLEAWADQELAADFVSGLVKRLEQDIDDVALIFTGDHERWTNHWQDRSKADAFKLAAAELLDRESNAGPGYHGPW